MRPYAWGSTTALPELLGEPPTGEPQAELWMGAHPGAPSLIDRGDGPVPLSEVIAADPHGELGPAGVAAFGPRLPFLLKLLAAAAPLSLQVHPGAARAAEGFAEEEARGVPRDAPHRNYRDDQHKPELLVALTPFQGLCGFRPAADTAALLSALDIDGLQPYVDILRASPEEAALREVLTAVLTADRDEIAATVRQAADAAGRLGAADGPYAAECAAYAGVARHHPGDPGLLAAMLLHHVSLRPGEGLYLGAGVPHAYLGGLGVEVMAGSDNVLRCGLTPKHVDVPELLRVVRFESAPPAVLTPAPPSDAGAAGAGAYATPAREFRLTRYVLAPGGGPRTLASDSAQIVLCTAGSAVLQEEGTRIALAPGRSAYLPAGSRPRVSGDGTIFRATVAV